MRKRGAKWSWNGVEKQHRNNFIDYFIIKQLKIKADSLQQMQQQTHLSVNSLGQDLGNLQESLEPVHDTTKNQITHLFWLAFFKFEEEASKLKLSYVEAKKVWWFYSEVIPIRFRQPVQTVGRARLELLDSAVSEGQQRQAARRGGGYLTISSPGADSAAPTPSAAGQVNRKKVQGSKKGATVFFGTSGPFPSTSQSALHELRQITGMREITLLREDIDRLWLEEKAQQQQASLAHLHRRRSELTVVGYVPYPLCVCVRCACGVRRVRPT